MTRQVDTEIIHVLPELRGFFYDINITIVALSRAIRCIFFFSLSRISQKDPVMKLLIAYRAGGLTFFIIIFFFFFCIYTFLFFLFFVSCDVPFCFGRNAAAGRNEAVIPCRFLWILSDVKCVAYTPVFAHKPVCFLQPRGNEMGVFHLLLGDPAPPPSFRQQDSGVTNMSET